MSSDADLDYVLYTSDADWRRAGADLYGAFCRDCGSSKHVEADHIKPKGQGGKSHVENLLFLCGAWGDCAAHARKTAGVLKIDRSWLTDEQVEYLDAVGWVRFYPDGAIMGAGWRHFTDNTEGADMAPRKTAAEKAAEEAANTPAEGEAPEEDETPYIDDEDGFAEPVADVVSLSDAAAAAMDSEGDPTQEHLDGTNFAKVKFVGMAWESAEIPGLKDEVEFTVKGTVVGHGQQVMADGDIREVATVKVTEVVRVIP